MLCGGNTVDTPLLLQRSAFLGMVSGSCVHTFVYMCVGNACVYVCAYVWYVHLYSV